MPTEQELKDAVRAERNRCIDILESELERGRGLLGLLDQAGRPVFDDEKTIACMEAIDYCMQLIKKNPTDGA